MNKYSFMHNWRVFFTVGAENFLPPENGAVFDGRGGHNRGYGHDDA